MNQWILKTAYRRNDRVNDQKRQLNNLLSEAIELASKVPLSV